MEPATVWRQGAPRPDWLKSNDPVVCGVRFAAGIITLGVGIVGVVKVGVMEGQTAWIAGSAVIALFGLLLIYLGWPRVPST